MSKSVDLPTDKHCEGIERVKVEQRRYRRIPTSLNVGIAWIDGFGFESAATAVVRDVSAGGFGIESRQNRPVGSRLKVTTQTNAIPCSVRHVTGKGDEFYLGLEILPSVDEISQTKESLEGLRIALARESFE